MNERGSLINLVQDNNYKTDLQYYSMYVYVLQRQPGSMEVFLKPDPCNITYINDIIRLSAYTSSNLELLLKPSVNTKNSVQDIKGVMHEQYFGCIVYVVEGMPYMPQ